MELGEDRYASRAEWVRSAKERFNFSQKTFKTDHVQNTDYREEESIFDTDENKRDGTIYLTKIQGFLLRMVLAVILFLCVLLMDKYNLENDTVNKKNIQKILTSNEQAHQVEDLARDWFQKNVMSVFHLPNE